MTKKTISIFGSTGSVGNTTLNILRENKEIFDVKILTDIKILMTLLHWQMNSILKLYVLLMNLI